MPRKTSTRRLTASRSSTICDIAQALGISAMTVSRVLNSHPQVSPETRRKVAQKAAELNYRPNRWARTLVTNRSQILGLVVPDISHSFFSEITRGIQEIIEEQGYNLLLCNTGRDAITEIREIDALLASRVDGLIIASEQSENSWEYFAALETQGVHFVLIDRFFRNLNCSYLTTDDVEVGRLATEHLIELGHRKIAHIRGSSISNARLRLEGYQTALRAHGIPEKAAWIVPGNFRVQDSYDAAMFLMSLEDRPTAIFAGNDTSAYGAVKGCVEAGFPVPRRVSVIGAGNIEGDQHPHPFLSTIHWDRLEIGREAARALLDAIAGGQPRTGARKVFPPSLLVRESTALPSE